jgi:hypothetical protein
MAQQPNIELEPADKPRTEPRPAAARRWNPNDKPGVITSPGAVPSGGSFGRPGPDTGFAYRLIRSTPNEGRTQALEHVLAALMAARASHFGRAPTSEDLEVASILCGIGEGLPDRLSERRQGWVEATAHEKSKGVTAVNDVGDELLRLKPAEVRSRVTH